MGKTFSEVMEDVPLRPPGRMELFQITRNYLGFYHSVGATARYSIPKAMLQKFCGIQDLVNATLTEILSKQSILGVTIEEEGTPRARWVRLKTINFREVVKMIDADPTSNLDKWVGEMHHSNFVTQPHLPIWRVIIIALAPENINHQNRDTISFAVGAALHHAIADGLSGGAFHLNFLDALNHLLEINSKPDCNPIISVPKLPLLPTLEQATPLPISFWFAIKRVFTELIYSPVDPLEWTGPPVSASAPRPPISNLQSFFLPCSLTSKLVAKCRAQKTTITGLMTVLVARKLALIYPTHSRFPGAVPISLRKFTKNTPRDMGVFVSDSRPWFSTEDNPPQGYIPCRSDPTNAGHVDEQFWGSARKCKAVVDEKASSPGDQSVGLLRFVSTNFTKFFLGQLGGKRKAAFEITNMGVLDGGVPADDCRDDGKPTFDRVMFTSGGCTYGVPYLVCLATAKNGDMCVSLTWVVGEIEDDDAREMSRWLEAELKGLAEKDETMDDL